MSRPRDAEAAPPDRLYSPDHLWIAGDGRVGVTRRILAALGPPIAIHLPPVGAETRAAERFAALESHKGTIDLYAPCDGRVATLNDALLTQLELLANDPFGEGWLLTIEGTVGGLMSAGEYLMRDCPGPHRR